MFAVSPCCWLPGEETEEVPEWSVSGELPLLDVVVDSVDTEGGSLNVAQIGFFLKNRLLYEFTCRAVFVPITSAIRLLDFNPVKTMASLNLLISSSDHRVLIFFTGAGCWARRKETSPWCHLLS